MKGYTRDKQLFAVWKEVTEALKASFAAPNWKRKAENTIFTLKKHLHEVLNTASVQNLQSTCRALRVHVPYQYEVLAQPEQAADEDLPEQYASLSLMSHVVFRQIQKRKLPHAMVVVSAFVCHRVGACDRELVCEVLPVNMKEILHVSLVGHRESS
jgi:hypothetical protein